MCHLLISFKPLAGIVADGNSDAFNLVLTCVRDDLYFNNALTASGAEDGIDIIFPFGSAETDLTTVENRENIKAKIANTEHWRIVYHKELHYWRIFANGAQKLGNGEAITVCFSDVKSDQIGQAVCSCTLLASVKTTTSNFRVVSETVEAPLKKISKPKIINFTACVLNVNGFIDIDTLKSLDTIPVNIRPYVCPPDPPGPKPPPPPPPSLKKVEFKWEVTNADMIFIYIDGVFKKVLCSNIGCSIIDVDSSAKEISLEIFFGGLYRTFWDKKTVSIID